MASSFSLVCMVIWNTRTFPFAPLYSACSGLTTFRSCDCCWCRLLPWWHHDITWSRTLYKAETHAAPVWVVVVYLYTDPVKLLPLGQLFLTVKIYNTKHSRLLPSTRSTEATANKLLRIGWSCHLLRDTLILLERLISIHILFKQPFWIVYITPPTLAQDTASTQNYFIFT